MYVALSRVKSLEGLFLTGKFNKKAITINERTKAEYDRLREYQSSETATNLNYNNIISFVLCNVRSLLKHIDDIKADNRFLLNDLIMCTETQMVNNRIEDIEIDNYSTTCNISVDHRFSSLAIYSKTDEVSKSNKVFSVLLLYRKQDWTIVSFYETLQYLLTTFEVDFVMGDFNMKPNAELSTVLSSYKLLVTGPTQLCGSTLDHIYVKKSLFCNFKVDVTIKSVFFTDYELVQMIISEKSDSCML